MSLGFPKEDFFVKCAFELNVRESLKEQCHEDFAALGQSLLLGFNHKQNASIKLRRRYQMNFIRKGLP